MFLFANVYSVVCILRAGGGGEERKHIKMHTLVQSMWKCKWIFIQSLNKQRGFKLSEKEITMELGMEKWETEQNWTW